MEAEKVKHHPVVEIVSHVDDAVDHVGHANHAVKAFTGGRAFRVYNTLRKNQRSIAAGTFGDGEKCAMAGGFQIFE